MKSGARRWIEAGLCAVPIAVFAVVAWAHSSVMDDGFIYLRVVHQLDSGHGPVFNIGQRVEAFTSPLWLAILTAADVVFPVRLEWIAVVAGITATVGGLALAAAGSARFMRQVEPDRLLVPFGLIGLLVLAPMWLYASTGLETGLVFLWLGTCMWVLAGWARDGRLPIAGQVVIGLGWLVRPELVVYTVVFLAAVLAAQWHRDTWPDRLRLLAVSLALPAAYELFRMGYYGVLVSNTAIVKESTKIRLERGRRYLRDYGGTYAIVVPIIVVVAGGYLPVVLRREPRLNRTLAVLAAFCGAAVLNTAYVLAVGGDYLHAWFLLPATFAFCAPVAVVPAARRFAASLALVPWAVVAAVALRPPDVLPGPAFLVPPVGNVTTNDVGWGPASPNRPPFGPDTLVVQGTSRQTGYQRLDVPASPGVPRPALVSYAAGIAGYAIGNKLYVLDELGLADPLTARLITPTYTGFNPPPGHEKLLPKPWIVARLVPEGTTVNRDELPTFSLAPDLAPSRSDADFQQQVVWARAAINCGPLRRLDRDVSAPLTPARFLGNLVDSFANTFLRVPPDPETAYHQLCGGGTPDGVSASASRPRPVPALFVSTAVATREARGWTAADGEAARHARPPAAYVLSVSGFV